MLKYINQFLSLVYLFIFKMPWRKVWRLYNKKSENVIWIYPCFPRQMAEYLGRSIIFNEFGFVWSMAENNIPFRIVLGRNIGKVHDSKIFYHASHEFMNIFKFIEYPEFLIGTIRALENQRNEMFLNSEEMAYWENKIYMHKMFSKLEVSQPITHCISTKTLADFDKLAYPFILKEIHSQGSKGLHKIENKEQQLERMDYLLRMGKHQILAQRIVDMTRDMRITIVGNEVILAYWRINPEKEWRPTSTSRGSSVDFGNFPEHWRSYFLEITHRMGLRAAAYDVCWEGDDVKTMPVILEVSPFFQPNPLLPAHLSHVAYRDYKKIIFTKAPYYKTRVDEYCRVADKKIKLFFNLN